MLTEDQIAGFKAMLLEEQSRYQQERTELIEPDRSRLLDETGEIADYEPNNLSDSASVLFDRERNMAAERNLDGILSKIERALTKIEEGTYGLSDIDGRPIPIERLEVMPYALTTVEQEEKM